MEHEKKYFASWWFWTLALIVISFPILFGMRSCGLIGGTIVERKVFENSFQYSEARKAEITVGDKQLDAIIQDIQFHPVTDEIMHIDFMELTAGKPVTIEVPVILNGLSRGVRNGGVMKHVFRKVSVRALPKDLPSEINIDVTDLRIGQGIRIDELTKEGDYVNVNF